MADGLAVKALEKLSKLEAYMDDVRRDQERDQDCIKDYKVRTITLENEVRQIKEEKAKLWEMHEDYGKFKAKLKSDLIKAKSSREGNWKKYKEVREIVDEIMKTYPDIRDFYVEAKKKIITLIIIGITVAVFGAVGINIAFILA